MNYGLIENGVVVRVIDADAEFVATQPEDWIELPYGVFMDWNYDGANFTDENGDPPPVEPAPVPLYRKLLTGPEWVELFTDAEWAWLKLQRTTNDRLDQMMDAIRWTNSIDISSSNMTEFYDWLVANGLPGGQARADELRQGIPG